MKAIVLLGLLSACAAATPVSAGVYATVSCFRGSRYDGDPHNVAGKGSCNKGRFIPNRHDPRRFIRGPGVVVRH